MMEEREGRKGKKRLGGNERIKREGKGKGKNNRLAGYG